MVLQVLLLMPIRTIMNYQYRHGSSLTVATKTLYADGGMTRYYQGMTAALVQGKPPYIVTLHERLTFNPQDQLHASVIPRLMLAYWRCCSQMVTSRDYHHQSKPSLRLPAQPLSG